MIAGFVGKHREVTHD